MMSIIDIIPNVFTLLHIHQFIAKTEMIRSELHQSDLSCSLYYKCYIYK